MACQPIRILVSVAVLDTVAGTLTFEKFVQEHKRTYERGSDDYKQRKSIFDARLADMTEHNRNERRMWTAGPNKYWDWKPEETASLRGWDGSVRPDHMSRGISSHASFLQRRKPLPDTKMWSTISLWSNVKNQESCGSCWAIAVSNVLEGHVEIHRGQKRTFSAQQIIMCTPNPRHCGGHGGCQGATAELGMQWVLDHGCATEQEIPYKGTDGECPQAAGHLAAGGPLSLAQNTTPAASKSIGGSAFGLKGWETLPVNKYEPLARALAELGPVAVSVAAGAWFQYLNGIFDGCGKDAVIDHAVTAMGYGIENGKKYWTIQNSWGEDWGEKGHIRLLRHEVDEYCGMNHDPQKGVGCEGDNTPVPVCGMCGVLFDSVIPHFS